ncbi:MAG: hypothetical protein A2V64_07810 [Bacteroidetes bacterium RBG_13_43_22]|nr:MAG: hypothetical protein A2V64_07810 [Bacteroidetes bacterium RBG_13_43_22]
MKALNVLKYVGFGILGVGLIIGVIFGVQALWNWLIPELFNGPVLTYWQTLGLFFLSKILLTGIAPGSQHNHDKKWKKKFQEKCKQKAAGEQNIITAEQV